jgi:methionyl aminopeptidase
VRQYARKNIKVGMTMTEIAEMIENATRALVGEDGLKAGIGFPTGVNRNHIAAHFSPNAGDKTVLEYEDVSRSGWFGRVRLLVGRGADRLRHSAHLVRR